MEQASNQCLQMGREMNLGRVEVGRGAGQVF